MLVWCVPDLRKGIHGELSVRCVQGPDSSRMNATNAALSASSSPLPSRFTSPPSRPRQSTSAARVLPPFLRVLPDELLPPCGKDERILVAPGAKNTGFVQIRTQRPTKSVVVT